MAAGAIRGGAAAGGAAGSVGGPYGAAFGAILGGATAGCLVVPRCRNFARNAGEDLFEAVLRVAEGSGDGKDTRIGEELINEDLDNYDRAIDAALDVSDGNGDAAAEEVAHRASGMHDVSAAVIEHPNSSVEDKQYAFEKAGTILYNAEAVLRAMEQRGVSSSATVERELSRIQDRYNNEPAFEFYPE
jgi:hypothetical protein